MPGRSLSWFYNEAIVVYISLAFTETVKMFAHLVRFVYLSQSEMIKESNYIYAAPKIKET